MALYLSVCNRYTFRIRQIVRYKTFKTIKANISHYNLLAYLTATCKLYGKVLFTGIGVV